MDSFNVSETEVTTNEKEPLELILEGENKKIELKASSTEEKMMWYNSMIKAKGIQAKVEEEKK